MRRMLLRLLLIAVTAFVAYCVVVIAGWSLLHFSLPTSETLAHWYLNEVTHGTDPELDTPYLRCSTYYLEKDRERYAGAEVRNVRVVETPGTGSGDTLRYLVVSFEYRLPNTTAWRMETLQTLLMTDFKPLQSRWLGCMG